MPGAERAADLQSDFGHGGVGHRLDHLRTVLDDPRCLRLDAYDIAGSVLQENDRQVRLTAELDELSRLASARRINRAIVADEADRLPFDRGMAAYRMRAISCLEIEKIGTVDDARDDFAH